MKEILHTPRPNLLDVVEIDGRLSQVRPGLNSIMYLDEKVKIGTIKAEYIHEINWDDFEFEKTNAEEYYVIDLRENNRISEEEYMAVHWGPEQEEHPYLRGHVTFFGIYNLKNRFKKYL